MPDDKEIYEVYIANIKPGATKKDLLEFLKKGVELPEDAVENIVFRERSAVISFTDRGVAERVVCLNGLPWNGDPSEEKKVYISWMPPALPPRPSSSPSLALPEPRPKHKKFLKVVFIGLATISFALLVYLLLTFLTKEQEQKNQPTTKSQSAQPVKQKNLDRKFDQLDKQLEELNHLLNE